MLVADEAVLDEDARNAALAAAADDGKGVCSRPIGVVELLAVVVVVVALGATVGKAQVNELVEHLVAQLLTQLVKAGVPTCLEGNPHLDAAGGAAVLRVDVNAHKEVRAGVDGNLGAVHEVYGGVAVPRHDDAGVAVGLELVSAGAGNGKGEVAFAQAVANGSGVAATVAGVDDNGLDAAVIVCAQAVGGKGSNAVVAGETDLLGLAVLVESVGLDGDV